MSVKIRMRCKKISVQKHWSQFENGAYPTQTTIEMEVVNTADKNDPNFLYSFYSGGTRFPLMTINDEAASQFELEKDYEILITPVE